MKRIFDLSIAILLVLFASVALLLISILVMVTSEGPVLFWSERVGKRNKIFRMPKFRSMITSTPTVATHLLDNPDSYLSPIGDFLRRSSLDELPQLLSVIKGDMSLVGPRPALYNSMDDVFKGYQERRHFTLVSVMFVCLELKIFKFLRLLVLLNYLGVLVCHI